MSGIKNTIICDIDGTLSDLSHRLHYIKPAEGAKADWRSFFATVDRDTRHVDIITILRVLSEGRVVVYVSGRSDECRAATEQWLLDAGCPSGRLWMRKAGDHRPDYQVKREILERHLRLTPDEVLCVLDDRDQVVEMWRERGFRVLQVARGDF